MEPFHASSPDPFPDLLARRPNLLLSCERLLKRPHECRHLAHAMLTPRDGFPPSRIDLSRPDLRLPNASRPLRSRWCLSRVTMVAPILPMYTFTACWNQIHGHTGIARGYRLIPSCCMPSQRAHLEISTSITSRDKLGVERCVLYSDRPLDLPLSMSITPRPLPRTDTRKLRNMRREERQ